MTSSESQLMSKLLYEESRWLWETKNYLLPLANDCKRVPTEVQNRKSLTSELKYKDRHDLLNCAVEKFLHERNVRYHDLRARHGPQASQIV